MLNILSHGSDPNDSTKNLASVRLGGVSQPQKGTYSDSTSEKLLQRGECGPQGLVGGTASYAWLSHLPFGTVREFWKLVWWPRLCNTVSVLNAVTEMPLKDG